MIVNSKRKLIGALLVALAVLALTVSAGVAADRKQELFDQIRSVYDVVEVWHKDEADLERFVSGAIQGGLEALGDPYTNYYTPEDYAGFLDSLNGSFSGVGAYLEQDGNYVVISAPIKGSPAARAGLMTGDRILEANGASLVGSTTDHAVSLIRGAVGTTVKLKIERPSERKTFEVTIVREQINIPEVDSRMLDGEIGYVQLSSFGDDAVRDFFRAVDSLKNQGAKGLVLDLRQNPGGYLHAAVEIASAFVPADEVVVWETAKNEKIALRSSGRLINLPTAVLVDKGSASASEVLAGAIQDYGVAPLVGVKTFGKGTVQQILNLQGGAGMKVTIAEYLTPKERHVHGIGLTPDYAVENLPADSERTAPMTFDRLMALKDIGLDVQQLQYRLKDLGYDPELRGYFGLKTKDAVEKFARANNLGTDGMVTEAFLTVLNQRVAEKVKAPEDQQLNRAQELVRLKLHP